MSPEERKGPIIPLVVIGVLAALGAGYYYWIEHERQETTTPPIETAAPQTPAEPAIRHPIQRAEPEGAKPLPPLSDSDEALRDTAAGLISREALERLFNLSSLVRRIVVTIDDLPRKKLSQRYNVAKPVEGPFLIYGKGDNIALSPDNYKRYASYVKMFEAVDTKKLSAAYIYFYPLFQEEYRNLGQPKKYFNDRVIEAIDDLLAAPDVKQPVKLVQPKVMYEFADPTLESLSAGQKMMIRMGPENAARVKAKLREVRAELASPR